MRVKVFLTLKVFLNVKKARQLTTTGSHVPLDRGDVPGITPQPKLVLDLSTLEEQKAELIDPVGTNILHKDIAQSSSRDEINPQKFCHPEHKPSKLPLRHHATANAILR